VLARDAQLAFFPVCAGASIFFTSLLDRLNARRTCFAEHLTSAIDLAHGSVASTHGRRRSLIEAFIVVDFVRKFIGREDAVAITSQREASTREAPLWNYGDNLEFKFDRIGP
jgi:hypothetical protein